MRLRLDLNKGSNYSFFSFKKSLYLNKIIRGGHWTLNDLLFHFANQLLQFITYFSIHSFLKVFRKITTISTMKRYLLQQVQGLLFLFFVSFIFLISYLLIWQMLQVFFWNGLNTWFWPYLISNFYPLCFETFSLILLVPNHLT